MNFKGYRGTKQKRGCVLARVLFDFSASYEHCDAYADCNYDYGYDDYSAHSAAC
jgi:hypothetical protein